jgi:RNA 2',3'-cyclic 3'-phosphodiesterase
MNNAKLFIVIDPNPVEKQALACICQELRAQFKTGRIYSWEMYHITLYFFPEATQDRIDEIKRLMKNAAAKQKSFSLITGQPEIFGSEDSANVWVSLPEGAGELAALHAKLEKTLAKAGFLGENKPYAPHITLGREIDIRKFDPPLSETILASVNLSANALTLMERRVEDGKTVFTPLASYPFKGK